MTCKHVGEKNKLKWRKIKLKSWEITILLARHSERDILGLSSWLCIRWRISRYKRWSRGKRWLYRLFMASFSAILFDIIFCQANTQWACVFQSQYFSLICVSIVSAKNWPFEWNSNFQLKSTFIAFCTSSYILPWCAISILFYSILIFYPGLLTAANYCVSVSFNHFIS